MGSATSQRVYRKGFRAALAGTCSRPGGVRPRPHEVPRPAAARATVVCAGAAVGYSSAYDGRRDLDGSDRASTQATAPAVAAVRRQLRPRPASPRHQLLRGRSRGRRHHRAHPVDGHLRGDHLARAARLAGQTPHPAHRPGADPPRDDHRHRLRARRQRRDRHDRVQAPDDPARRGRAGGDPQAAGRTPRHQPQHVLRRRLRLPAHRDVLRHDLRPHRAHQRRAVLRQPDDGAQGYARHRLPLLQLRHHHDHGLRRLHGGHGLRPHDRGARGDLRPALPDHGGGARGTEPRAAEPPRPAHGRGGGARRRCGPRCVEWWPRRRPRGDAGPDGEAGQVGGTEPPGGTGPTGDTPPSSAQAADD